MGSSGERNSSVRQNNTGNSLTSLVLTEMSSMIRGEMSRKELSENVPESFASYQENPVGFIRDILKQNITEDIEELCNSVRDNVITEARSANGVGKTHSAASIITWFYKCFPGAQVYCAAAPPEDNLRRLLWGEISKIINKNKGLFINDKPSSTPLQISKSPTEFIAGVTIPQESDPEKRKARFAGKHAPALLFVIDEGDGVPPEIYEAIESCMSGGFARLLILFNPRAQAGPVYQMEKRGTAKIVHLSAFNHPNVITGQDKIPGAVTREVTVRRIHEWTRECFPGERLTSDTFLVPKYLDGYVGEKRIKGQFYPPLKSTLRKVIEPAFSYMVLGDYPAFNENQLISRDWIVRAQENWKKYVEKHGEITPIRVPPLLGLDVAEFGGDFNVLTPRYDYFVASQKLWQGVDINETAKIVFEECIFLKPEGVFVDANGLGAGVPPILKEKGVEDAHRILVQESPTEEAETGGLTLGQFERIRDQGFWHMREWFKDEPRAMIPPDTELEEELLALSYSRNQRNRIKIVSNDVLKDKLGRSIDRAFSLMLTFCPIPDDSSAGYYAGANYLKD